MPNKKFKKHKPKIGGLTKNVNTFRSNKNKSCFTKKNKCFKEKIKESKN